jgi:hypothetical protein
MVLDGRDLTLGRQELVEVPLVWRFFSQEV